jgi:peptide/nickel transport system substrate-binding protein
MVAMWANYISAHNKTLTHGENIAANWDNDGAKLTERWWKA